MLVRRTMGDATQAVSQAGNIAAGVVPAVAGSSVAGILGVSAAVAVPIVGAAIVGITAGIVALINSGCGQSCIITSQWADQAGELLVRNLHAYDALPRPRTRAQQAAALANFDAIWNWLVQQCSQVSGGAGENCIKDRQAGACHWKDASGQCWNWFSGMRDPIAHDPDVVDDATAALSVFSRPGADLLVAAGLLLVGMLL